MSVETMADSMLSMRRYVAPIASAAPRASMDFPEPGSPANTTRNAPCTLPRISSHGPRPACRRAQR